MSQVWLCGRTRRWRHRSPGCRCTSSHTGWVARAAHILPCVRSLHPRCANDRAARKPCMQCSWVVVAGVSAYSISVCPLGTERHPETRCPADMYRASCAGLCRAGAGARGWHGCGVPPGRRPGVALLRGLGWRGRARSPDTVRPSCPARSALSFFVVDKRNPSFRLFVFLHGSQMPHVAICKLSRTPHVLPAEGTLTAASADRMAATELVPGTALWLASHGCQQKKSVEQTQKQYAVC